MKLKQIIEKVKNTEPLSLHTKNDVLQINAKYGSQGQILGYEIIIRITMKCNLDCQFCFVSNRIEIKEKWVDNLIDSLKDLNLKDSNIVLSGGEPTLYPKYFEMLEKLKSTGAHLVTQTNAVVFSRNKFFNKLNLKSHSFFISFPSAVEDEYNNITNSNHYRDFVEAVKKLSKHYNVSLNYVLYKGNYKSFEKSMELIYKNFNLENTRLVISNLGMLSKFEHFDKLTKYTNIINKIREPLSLYNGKINFGFTVSGGCSFPLCILNKIINLEHETFFKAIEENIGFKNFDKQFYKNEKCLCCKYNKYCQGFPAEYIKKFGDEEIQEII